VPSGVWALLAAALVVTALVLLDRGPDRSQPVGRSVPSSDPSIAPAAAGNPTPEAGRRHHRVDRQEPRPTHIRIPAIGVSARVVRLGLARDGTMETPGDYDDTGWFAPGPEPGERGAAVIAGHIDSKTGPAVFYRLGELHRGDSIRVTVAGGKTIRFMVDGVERWPKAKFPTKRVFGTTRAATLRLITCSGAFDRATGHYVDNTIVYAVRGTAGRN
jgi:LPXTG-site transpeptidase (sortase) family protein